MRILLTGARGQLGRSLTGRRADHGPLSWVSTDLEDLDITDPVAVKRFLEQSAPDAIVNCAAYTTVDRAEEEPQQAFRINATGPANLAAAALERKIPLIHISTDYVFPGNGTRPYRESDPTGAGTVYGRSKLAGEELVMESGARSVIIRTSWLYSEFGHNFVRTILRLGRERESLRVVDDQSGSPTYAGDLAAAIIRVLSELETKPDWPVQPAVYHFCNTGKATWYELASQIVRITNLPCRIIPVSTAEYPQKAARPAYSVLDNSLFRSTFGAQIPNWKESLGICLRQI
ncbi:MAG: dTDP-4-dehydrorhamnose reductase [Bacteroidales bacterium]